MYRKRLAPSIMVMLFGIGVVGCGGGAESPPPTQDAAPSSPGVGMDNATGDGMDAMQVDAAMMHRHAREADSTVAAIRPHVQQMRQLPAEQQHARMAEHVNHVSRMLSMMDRHIREMDMGMGMDDHHMGAMMGMSAEQHRSMVEEMRTLRTETEQLQTASVEDLRLRMPDHLDRIERTSHRMEQSAAHMRNL